MKEIYPKNSERPILYDEIDSNIVEGHRWYLHDGYPARRVGSDGSKRLHRMIMGDKSGFQIDHINGDRLDVRRENLRYVTPNENRQNRRLTHCKNKSGFRGVCFDKSKGKWRAYCSTPKVKRFTVGRYENIEDAAIAAKNARLKFMSGATA